MTILLNPCLRHQMHLVCSHHKPANRTSSRPAHLTPDASEEKKKKLSVSTSTCLPSELTCFRVKVVCFDPRLAMKSNDSTPGPQDSQSKPHSFFPPQSASCAKQHQWWRPASIDRVAVPTPGVSGLCRMFAIRPLGHRDLTAICMAGVTAPMNDLVMCLCLKKNVRESEMFPDDGAPLTSGSPRKSEFDQH